MQFPRLRSGWRSLGMCVALSGGSRMKRPRKVSTSPCVRVGRRGCGRRWPRRGRRREWFRELSVLSGSRRRVRDTSGRRCREQTAETRVSFGAARKWCRIQALPIEGRTGHPESREDLAPESAMEELFSFGHVVAGFAALKAVELTVLAETYLVVALA